MNTLEEQNMFIFFLHQNYLRKVFKKISQKHWTSPLLIMFLIFGLHLKLHKHICSLAPSVSKTGEGGGGWEGVKATFGKCPKVRSFYLGMASLSELIN